MYLISFFILVFLLGGIPFGLLISRYWLKIDIRQQGSGNIGMTNVMRVGGKLPGLLTFVLDFGKGSVAVLLAKTFIPDMVTDRSHSYHLYTIRVTKPFKLSRNQLYKKLKDNGIRTTVYWMPIHEYAAYRKFAKKSNIVNTSKIYDEILALPLFPNISKKHQDAVIKVIKSSLTD